MGELSELSRRIAEQFQAAFGQTPLAERVNDVLAQAGTLGRFRDMEHLRGETGDLLCSLLQLCNECGWEPTALAAETLNKLAGRQDNAARLGRKLRIGLYRGAFDPVHLGHLEVAAEVLRIGGVDEVWLMPCYDHLGGKSMAPAAHRLEMCRLAARSVRGVGVFDYEIRHQFRGETSHLVKKLLGEEIARSRCDFSLIIGQDNADTLTTGANADGLERLTPLIVLPRSGPAVSQASAWYLRPPHRYLENAKQEVSISSTEVRTLLRGGDAQVDGLLPPEVRGYIRTHGLYPPEAMPASGTSRTIVVFASTFDPPGRYHRSAVEAVLAAGFDEVSVCPSRRPNAGQVEHAARHHQAALIDLAFRGMAGVRVDLTDLDESTFTPQADLEKRYLADGEVWHVVGVELVLGGRSRRSIIHGLWERGAQMWEQSRFVVLHPPGAPPAEADRPPNCRLIAVAGHVPSADLRARIYDGTGTDQLLSPDVAQYVARHRLYALGQADSAIRLVLDRPRLKLVFDERNEKARAVAARFESLVGDPPDLVLAIGGDGTMLHAIRQHWRLRVPFLGVNAGHLGFLMNERLPAELGGLELGIRPQPMLRVEAETPAGRVSRSLAYTDAWLERAEGQAAWIRLDVDGQTHIPKLVGDGMLVATPSGSSAYARAMGASPLPLDTNALTLAGSNVFRPRFWKPMALSSDATIGLTSLDRSGKRPVRAFLDGSPLGVVQSLTVRRSSIAAVELAFTREFNPSDKLLRSLLPPAEADKW